MTVIVPGRPPRPVVVTPAPDAVSVTAPVRVVKGPKGDKGDPGDVGAVGWADVTGKPETFPPATHAHAVAGVTGLQAALDGKQAAGSYATAAQGALAATALQPGASIPWTDVTGKPSFFSGAYGDLSGIPSTFAPSAHNQAWGTITGTPTTLAGYGITDAQPLAAVLTATTASFTTAQESKLSGIPAGGIADGDKGDLTVSASGTVWTIDAAAVGNSKLANMLEARFKGRSSGAGTGSPQDMTGTQATAMLDTFTDTLKGVVPASGGSSTFLKADATWADVFRGLALPMKPAAGVYIGPATSGAALGTVAQVANRNTIAPFCPAFDISIDQVAISVSTGVASSLAKVVIYASDANGRPSTVLAESGDIDCATAATVTASLSLSFVAGRIYWIGVRSSSTQTLRSLPAAAFPVLSYTSAASPVIQTVLAKTETYANAAATWTYTTGQHSSLTVPIVLMRVA